MTIEQGTSFDKYVESMLALRDQLNQAEPGLASRLPVCTFIGETSITATGTDPQHPGVGFISGAHWHRRNEGGKDRELHHNIDMTSWPDCILVQ